MNQLALVLPLPVRVPDDSTQCGVLLRALRRGETLTMAEALTRYGIGALSQRVGDLKRAGWPIVATTEKTRNGARVARYSMAAAA